MDTVSMGTTLFNVLWEFVTILRRRFDNSNPPFHRGIEAAKAYHQFRNTWDVLLEMGDLIKSNARSPDMVSLPSLLNTSNVLNWLRDLLHALGSADLLLQRMPVDETTDNRILCQHLERAERAFIELFVTIVSGREAPSSARLPGSHGPLHSIQSSFYESPFDITVEGPHAEDIATQLTHVNSDHDVYTLVIQEIAKQWVNDKLKSASTVQDCEEAQSYVLTVLSSVLSAEICNIEENVMNALQIEPLSYARLVELQNRVMKEIERERNKKFSIAFCGLVKAGKSALLNAFVGRPILPSGELPATACPCRIQHVKGKSEPTLTIDQEYFQDAIEKLRLKKPTDNNSLSLLDDDPNVLDDSNVLDDFESRSVENRRKFEEKSYRIPGHASGDHGVTDLLMQVNDIIRLCSRLNVKLDPPDPSKWPRLEIEVEALRDKHLEGSFEFFDLPGLGEVQTKRGMGYFDLETMVRRVAEDVGDVVPVISLKEVAKREWQNKLPPLIQLALGRSPEVAICTHLDQVVEHQEQLGAIVAREFNIKSPNVLKCAPRLGFGARKILRLSEAKLPKYRTIWDNPITRECAVVILGQGNPQRMFGTFPHEEWCSAVKEQLKKSNLQDTIECLVDDMIVSSPRRALKTHGQRIRKLLKMVINARRLALTSASHAGPLNQVVIQKYKDVLHAFPFTIMPPEMFQEIELKLEPHAADLEEHGLGAANKAISKVQSQIRLAMKEGNDLVFDGQSDAEHFLRQVLMDLNEALSDLKHTFVSKVRVFGVEYMTTTLEKKIEASRKDALRDELMDELQDRRDSIERLVFSLIRSHALAKHATKNDARGRTFNSIKAQISKLVDGKKAVDILAQAQEGDNSPVDELTTRIVQLGFMRRAPDTEISSSLPRSQLFTKRLEPHVVDKKDLLGVLKGFIVRPFCDGLKKEGKETLVQMWRSSLKAAHDAVSEVLEDVERRYENTPKQMSTDARAVSRILSLIAAEAALEKLLI